MLDSDEIIELKRKQSEGSYEVFKLKSKNHVKNFIINIPILPCVVIDIPKECNTIDKEQIYEMIYNNFEELCKMIWDTKPVILKGKEKNKKVCINYVQNIIGWEEIALDFIFYFRRLRDDGITKRSKLMMNKVFDNVEKEKEKCRKNNDIQNKDIKFIQNSLVTKSRPLKKITTRNFHENIIVTKYPEYYNTELKHRLLSLE